MPEPIGPGGPGDPERAAHADAGVPTAGPLFDRRLFLTAAGAVAGGLALGGLAGSRGRIAPAGASPSEPSIPARPRTVADAPPVAMVTLDSGVTAPVARWVRQENELPGTVDWVVFGVQTPHALEGFADRVSAAVGDEVTLFVNTTARTVAFQAFRLGYYQSLGGRLVYTSDTVAGRQQAPPELVPGLNTVVCKWEPTFTFTVTDTWPPGIYVLKLQGDGGQQQYIPLTVRDDTSRSAFVVQNSVTTWQAYNLWGDYSLYYGAAPGGRSDFAHRARAVSFDRPYPKEWAQGAADLLGNEFPVVYQMERLGLDVSYWTDVDLHARPQLLANHRCLLSMGHDEYWSRPMRDAAALALSGGVNLAFLGANACYRQIRLAPSPVGPDRLQVCYKDAAEDPVTASDPTMATVNWVQPPLDDPESTLLGTMYQSVGADDPMVVTDASAWLWDGCGLSDGQALPSVVQGEYDRFVPVLPGPRNVDVLAHSPVAHQGNWSDVTYYTAPGGGGVLATGNASWVGKLSDTTGFPWDVVPQAIPGVTDVLLRAMENVYGRLGAGPAAGGGASTGNWPAVYGAAAAQGTAAGSNSA